LHVGYNDLESKTPDEVIQELEDLISELKRELPSSKLIVAELLPRFYKKTSSEFDEKILLYSSLLKNCCFDINAEYVNCEQMSSDDLYDGIHLNEYGIKLYVKCVKKVLNPHLGVQTELKTENESRKIRI
jgi:lysophospholipase L1-like esterase